MKHLEIVDLLLKQKQIKTGVGVFSLFTTFKSIEIPSFIKTIGAGAFLGCSIQSSKIRSSVTSINKSAFKGCDSLKGIEVPSSVTALEESTFVDCTSLLNVDIPSSVKSIGKDCFVQCLSLKKKRNSIVCYINWQWLFL